MLRIKNWSSFQHYKDRNPPWIKLATDTFQNYEFSCLQDASKLLAICIWTLASRSKDGEIPADFEWIKRQCNLGQMVKIEHLKELINKGYLIDASNTLADCKQSACPETEAYREEEEEEEYPPHKPPRKGGVRLPKKPTPDEARAFEQFWVRYPRRQGKAQAEKSFINQTRKGVSTNDIIAGAERSAEFWKCEGTEQRFIPLPATWLNQGRWDDELVASRANGAGGQQPRESAYTAEANRLIAKYEAQAAAEREAALGQC